MKYKGTDYQMCDAWFLNVDDRIHSFNLKLNDATQVKAMAHSYSDDLLHFYPCKDILPASFDESTPDDYLDKWSGSACTSLDGTHYVYYTMRNKFESQKIGVAISKDLENFEVYENNPILVPCKDIFFYKDELGLKEDCRDFRVIYYEKENKFLGYFATMAEVDGRLVGVVGVAESTDMLNWSNQSIAYVARFDGVIEVPDVYFLDGKWYLTALTHTNFGAKGTFSDPNVQSGTIYASSDSPYGPFTEGADNVFIGGTYDSGFTCSTFMYKGKRYLMYIDKSEGEWAVSLPKEVRVINGNLRPCYTDILKKIRQKTIVERLDLKDLERQPTSIAWNTGSAVAENVENGISIKTNKYSYQSFMIKSETSPSAEIEFNAVLNGVEGGIVVKSENAHYTITANTKEKELILYEKSIYYTVLCKRVFEFEEGKEYNFRIILLEGQIEIYVDNVLVLQNAFKTGENMTFGLISGCGESIYKSFKIYRLED